MHLTKTLTLLLITTVFSYAQQSIGLQDEVEVIRDKNGINHIYAQNEHDLFFSQGYLAAKDRLFQFEIWRRQATGTMAEILGERELARDKGVRLFKFRGDKKSELNHYHPRGEEIVDAFVDGINAYISEVLENPELLPLEFQLLNINPQPWTWEVVISRHQGLLQNVKDELSYSRVVALLGPDEAGKLFYFHPNKPNLELAPSIPEELLFKDILAPYNAFRSPVAFKPEDIIVEARGKQVAEASVIREEIEDALDLEKFSIGSNNWLVSGQKTASGYPIMANDPHRLHAVPSLRYWAHLHAPGWNVIGGGEPTIPGISIGHNEFGAWGLTIFETDNEDLRIYDIDPENPHRYFYKDAWQEMREIRDTIKVKGKNDVYLTHYYTVHGPITFIDEELNKAVAVECAWLEPGGAPYLASLRMDQASNWEEFRDACAYNHIPAENMIWADREGNIGWQATGITPIRKDFSGLVASLGDGSKDWEGYLPIKERPNKLNMEAGFFATANENVTPKDYTRKDALGYEWADAFRGDRVREVLAAGDSFTLSEMGELQNDYLSLPAREIIPYLEALSFDEERHQKAKDMLQEWDFRLTKESVAAGIYVMWERIIRSDIRLLAVPEEAQPYISSLQLTKVLEWLENPSNLFEGNATDTRDVFLKTSFEKAISELEEKLGMEMENWHYGQKDYKHALIRHPLSSALAESWGQKLNAGPVPRGGYSFTPGANAYVDNNVTGASFRILVDLGDWEATKGINSPGQSGNPNSPFYKNLFPIWAADAYFTVPFSYEKVVEMSVERTIYK